MAEATGSNHTIRALTEIRKRILSGELAGGERLFEVPLAEMLNISRTPVREAMSRLAEEGLLERAKSTGFAVRAFGVEDVIDAIELRGVLEGTAARLAAERGADPELLAQMTEVVERLDACFRDDSVDFEIYSRGNEDFHRILTRLSGSKIIEWELDRVVHLPFASPSAFLPDKVNLQSRQSSLVFAQAQHREILAAIKAREGSRAEALAREHARTARRDLEEAMKKKGEAGQLPGLALVVT
ncbi:GntR family transcriptional regulator [Roseibium aggregatum]|uniref:GntR family transcriptional regulator n=1 Tax=Roseibium aggregatum TaxID=187304 RepID=A0A939EJJ9_9HYPH|nr:GntR family transcriptional regulator [Roseibium aggregatum]MBN9673493.1 GntR family transcriptional regulator [Roseibium aggregatum]